MYLNPQYVKEAQVEKLISKILAKNGLLSSPEASPAPQSQQQEEHKEEEEEMMNPNTEISDYLEDFSELDNAGHETKEETGAAEEVRVD